MGASHSVEQDAPLREIEDPEPDVLEPEYEEEDTYEEEDDTRWLWPFI